MTTQLFGTTKAKEEAKEGAAEGAADGFVTDEEAAFITRLKGG